MKKEQLTVDKVRNLEQLSYQIKCTEEDAQRISEPLPEDIQDSIWLSGSPIRMYDDIMKRHSVGYLLETFRLLLYAQLQKNAQELKRKLLQEINVE